MKLKYITIALFLTIISSQAYYASATPVFENMEPRIESCSVQLWDELVSLILEVDDSIDSDVIKPEASFEKDLGFDSLSMIDLFSKCEETFGFEIPVDNIESMHCVIDLYDFINNMLFLLSHMQPLIPTSL